MAMEQSQKIPVQSQTIHPQSQPYCQLPCCQPQQVHQSYYAPQPIHQPVHHQTHQAPSYYPTHAPSYYGSQGTYGEPPIPLPNLYRS